jgi:hypothetical protein
MGQTRRRRSRSGSTVAMGGTPVRHARSSLASLVPSVVVIVAIGAFALVGPAPHATGAPSPPTSIPGLVMCSGARQYKPVSMHWCTSLCSSYITGLTWQSWTGNSAMGIGTLMSNNGVPNCAEGKWAAHPGYRVVLSKPARVSYCQGTRQVTRLLYTRSSFSGTYSLPLLHGPCT